jgi:hypothetical protein
MQEELPVALASPDLQARLYLKTSFHHSNSDILGFWYHTLEVYSKCHLSKPGMDRILAIAGLAIEVAQVLKNRGELNLKCPESYVAGLWLHDLCHGLLWEQDHEAGAVVEVIKKAPSWSFASLLTPVRWPERDRKGRQQCTILGVYLEQEQTLQGGEPASSALQDGDAEYDPPKWKYHDCRPLSLGSRIEDDDMTGAFDPRQIGGRLHILARVYTVHIRGYLVTEDNLRLAALATAYSDIPRSARWRGLCGVKDPDLIAGWASPERLENIAGFCSDSGVAVLALHISTRYVRSGLLIKRHDPVFDVLLVEEVPGHNTFRRLGVGRVFESGLIAEFEKVKERAIVLL